MTRYLTPDELGEINTSIVGPGRLRDFGLLESAAARPQQSAFGADAFPTLHEKAAALFHGLIRSHPFLDGNKRTAVIAVGVFYNLNGWWLTTTDEALVALAIDVAEGLIDVVGIAGRLKDMTRPLDTDQT